MSASFATFINIGFLQKFNVVAQNTILFGELLELAAVSVLLQGLCHQKTLHDRVEETSVTSVNHSMRHIKISDIFFEEIAFLMDIAIKLIRFLRWNGFFLEV